MSVAPLLTGWRHAAAAALFAFALAAPALAQGAEPLVSTQWLKAHLADPGIVVLDIRSAIDGGSRETYAKGHIPGAVYSNYDKAGWRVTRGGVPFLLPTVPELEKLIGEAGIDEDNHVVIVPAGVHATDFGSAARVYWTLKIAGLKRVSILDGGYAAWTADAGNRVETGIKPPDPKIYTVTLDKNLLASMAEVDRIARRGGATLIDARPQSFYLGKVKAPLAKAYGHIRGALNLDSAEFYDARSNRLKPRAALARIAAAIPAGPTVSYCNTGHWASTDWFVLSELLGRKDVRLYDGSMVEWSADTQRPIVSSRTKWDDLMKVLGLGT
jgi:thiosulfate/3-mercaptopyruvate sulfurtransferase